MSEILKGSVDGGSRWAMLATAEAVAVTFFGTACVQVRLAAPELEHIGSEASSDGSTTHELARFSASFEAQEHHKVERPVYGFPKCTRCGGEEYSGMTLPRAVWPL